MLSFRMQLKTKTIAKIGAGLFLVYVVASIGLYASQDKLLFQSERLLRSYAYEFDGTFEEYFIDVEEGVQLNALLFITDQPTRGLVLYFHGNADNLSRWGNNAKDFTTLGYDILMIDYRGYGKSGGAPTEEALYADAVAVWRWAKEKKISERIIIYGRSLGAAVASKLASQVNPDLLILETPFDELKGAAFPSLMRKFYFLPFEFHFPTKAFLPSVACRKVIFHGTDDWVVPLSSAIKLKPLVASEDDFIIIEGGNHNNLRNFKEYHTKLAEILK